jgi:hypothetical protein
MERAVQGGGITASPPEDGWAHALEINTTGVDSNRARPPHRRHQLPQLLPLRLCPCLELRRRRPQVLVHRGHRLAQLLRELGRERGQCGFLWVVDSGICGSDGGVERVPRLSNLGLRRFAGSAARAGRRGAPVTPEDQRAAPRSAPRSRAVPGPPGVRPGRPRCGDRACNDLECCWKRPGGGSCSGSRGGKKTRPRRSQGSSQRQPYCIAYRSLPRGRCDMSERGGRAAGWGERAQRARRAAGGAQLPGGPRPRCRGRLAALYSLFDPCLIVAWCWGGGQACRGCSCTGAGQGAGARRALCVLTCPRHTQRSAARLGAHSGRSGRSEDGG